MNHIMKYVILLFFFLASVTCFAQDLDCTDFNEGTFIGTSPQLPGMEFKVSRKGNTQIETLIKVPQELIDNGMPTTAVHATFEIIEDCMYRFLYDDSKMELDKYQIATNESGGIIVIIESIEENCFFYTSKSISNNVEMVLEGTLCKEL